MSVIQYDSLDHEMAMAYGDEFRLHEVGPFEWAGFAHRTGTPRALLAREMHRMDKAALAAAPAQAGEAAYMGNERELVERIAAFVQDQARKLLEHAAPTRKVVATLL